MESRSFDRFTVFLARRLGRRRLLGGLLGTGGTALLAQAPSALACPRGRRCGEDQCCRGNKVCVNGHCCKRNRRCGGRCCNANQVCLNRRCCLRSRACGNTCCLPHEACRDGKCVPEHCADGVTNDGETDTDCGGTCREFRFCQLAERCEVSDDCEPPLLCAGRAATCPGARPELPRCLACEANVDCDLFQPNRPVCVCGFCQECQRDGDCPQTTLKRFCVEPLAGGCRDGQPCKCRECRTDSDCLPGAFCDEENVCSPRTFCEPDQNFCTQTEGNFFCGGSASNCTCHRHVSGSMVCVGPPHDDEGNSRPCSPCESDSDCVETGFGAGAHCIDMSGPNCACPGSNGRECRRACPELT